MLAPTLQVLRLEMTDPATSFIPFVRILTSKLIPFDVPLFFQVADTCSVEIIIAQLCGGSL
jgi:hypothetical protein